MSLILQKFLASLPGLIPTLVLPTGFVPVEDLVEALAEHRRRHIVSGYLSFYKHFSGQPKHKNNSHSVFFFHPLCKANCEPLGNLLIIQNENKPVITPDDSSFGGCIIFTFAYPVAVINFGLLDPEEIANITVRTKSPRGISCSFIF
jgi:hypothetical protein